MAAPGRKPKPTHLKALHGNPGKRPLNPKEPKPKATVPKCPSWLSKEAKQEWRRLSKELEPLGLLSTIDGQMFALLCQAWADYRRAVELRDKSDVLIKGKRGLVKNPAMQIARDAAQTIIRISTEFGMTPSSRSRLSIEGREEFDEFEEFLRYG